MDEKYHWLRSRSKVGEKVIGLLDVYFTYSMNHIDTKEKLGKYIIFVVSSTQGIALNPVTTQSTIRIIETLPFQKELFSPGD